MPRTARTIFPGVPHHVVARGVDRCLLFRHGFDKRRYLNRFAATAAALEVQVHAYCLMDNHVHWILTPPNPTALANHSSPMDLNHFWTAMRYVETNPRRAGFRGRPEEWEFSSAKAHLTGEADQDIRLELLDWERLYGPTRWRGFLDETDWEREARLRHTIKCSRPCGSTAWLTDQQRRHGPFPKWRPTGRPPNSERVSRRAAS
ncbi:MAG: transposase [Bryobacterales bacterium]|nr:transposase [Bryobacterales bacterium]